jgi:hypothetical protein
MTIRIHAEPDTFADRVLAALGKERAYILPPPGIENELGPFVQTAARRESFLACLLRRKNAPLPNGRLTRKQVADLLSGQ